MKILKFFIKSTSFEVTFKMTRITIAMTVIAVSIIFNVTSKEILIENTKESGTSLEKRIVHLENLVVNFAQKVPLEL